VESRWGKVRRGIRWKLAKTEENIRPRGKGGSGWGVWFWCSGRRGATKVAGQTKNTHTQRKKQKDQYNCEEADKKEEKDVGKKREQAYSRRKQSI